VKYKKLTITDPKELTFGFAPKPVKTRRGLVIGNGCVYPELNFTLPPMSINSSTFNDIREQYRGIISESLARARELESNGVIFEFETLLEMTLKPEYGIELVKIMNDVCEEYYQKYGFKSEIRLTPNDIRDYERPPKMYSSSYLEQMLELFEKGALAGGDILSIESTGGKEICDEAILNCDIKQVVFALSVLGVRDMKNLWKKIVEIAKRTNKIPGGDTACGFGNTAMVLAEKNFIPKVFAAIVRIATVVRTLVAYEEGAVGPDKDCAYEGPYIKAITGIPISMEGKTAACAHLSPLGNIAAACCDLWSNESVQNIKLLGGFAPTVYLEQLEYDTRLFNQSISKGKDTALLLRDLFVESDIHFDPQALILAPDNVIIIATEILKGKNYIEGAVLGCLKGLEIIENAVNQKTLKISERENKWINTIREDLNSIPSDENKFIEEILPFIDKEKCILKEYGI
jgi:methanol---5-hydroxybenzimidazolylcobamide Co-methyltransferase